MSDMVSDTEGTPDEIEHRSGFLPIETNGFDRGFISVVIFIALHLLWMRFLEPEPLALPLWWATVSSIVIGLIVIRWG